MTQHYIRLGVVPVAPIIAAVRARMDNPDLPKEVTVLGTSVKISGVRLQTFASHPLHCSDPACCIQATHFAVERSGQPAHTNGQSHDRYHLNLYGLDADGQEVLMTHDHTLARGLGGADHLSNTTIMCSPCNCRKSKFESKACKMLPRNADAAMERDVGVRKVERTLEHMKRMAQRKGLNLRAYQDYCEAEVLRQPSLGHTTMSQRPVRRKVAQKLGISTEALTFFKHEHNQYEIARRKPPLDVSSEGVLLLAEKQAPLPGARRRVSP